MRSERSRWLIEPRFDGRGLTSAAVRHYPGFVAGAAVGASVLAASGSDSDYSLGDRIVLGTLVGGGTGLVWGAIVGAFLHERPVLYLAPVATVRLVPAFSPHGVGVVLRAQF